MKVARTPARTSQLEGRLYRTARYVAAGRADNTTFLLNKKTGRYYKLDDVGSELWALLRNSIGMDKPTILRELSAMYEVPQEHIAEDVTTLLSTLMGYDVIEMELGVRRQ